MGNYLVKRLFSMLITLWFVITITFFLMHSIPGGPFTREKELPPQVIEALNEKYNLDAPLYEQYFDYLKGVVTFDLGPSFKMTGVAVTELIKKGFPYSARMGGLAALVVLVIGIPIGIISALKQNSIIDYIVTIVATVGVAVPGFVVATVYIYIFSSKLSLVPSFGLDSWQSYIGPVLALSFFSLAFVMRLMRSSMLEVLGADYIRTARAKGIPEPIVIFKHALKNAIIPIITYIGPMVAAIVTGSFVIEKIFAIPGMGKYFVESVGNRDYTVLMGTTVFYAALVIVAILTVDIAYTLVDPRIKFGD
jgi:oligopeptide transport system permease protein